MFEELGISLGTAPVVLIALYFVIKWAVKNAIKESTRYLCEMLKNGTDEYEQENEESESTEE